MKEKSYEYMFCGSMAKERNPEHGALLDAELLAAVYIELTCARQSALPLEPRTRSPSNVHAATAVCHVSVIAQSTIVAHIASGRRLATVLE